MFLLSRRLKQMSALPSAQTLTGQVPVAIGPVTFVWARRAMSEPSKGLNGRRRMSMCFLNQKGDFALAAAARPNKQKPVN